MLPRGFLSVFSAFLKGGASHLGRMGYSPCADGIKQEVETGDSDDREVVFIRHV